MDIDIDIEREVTHEARHQVWLCSADAHKLSDVGGDEVRVNPTYWPLHDIVITNIVWCMAYKGRVGGRICMEQDFRNGIAVVWVMRMGGGDKGMIDSCTHKN